MSGTHESAEVPFILTQRPYGYYTTLADAIAGIQFPAPGLEVYITSEDAFYYYNGTTWIKEELQGGGAPVTNLENKLFNVQYFEIINSGTSGTLTPPQGGAWGDITTIALDQFGGGIDIFVSEEAFGYPTGESVEDISTPLVTDVVAATLDSSGNWNLVGTPDTYPIALVYYYKVKLVDMDSTYSIGGMNGFASTNLSADVYALQQQQALNASLVISAGRDANVTNSYLQNEGTFMNITPVIAPYDCFLTEITVATNGNETWTAEVRDNGVLIPGASLVTIAAATNTGTYNIAIAAGTKLMIYCNGTAINRPKVNCIFKRS